MNNTKKPSKFQERLNAAAKKRINPEDGGAMNDKLKLHKMNVNEDDVKLFSLRDMDAIILAIEDKVIPRNDMPDTGNDAHLGYNTAIRECVTLLKRIARETQLKLHNQGT